MENKPVNFRKGRYRLRYRGTICTNCGHPLDMSDRYCPNCSQVNSTKKPTIRDYFDEFLGSLLSYDSKLLKTLAALLIHPGRITQDYINGKRVSYTNPFRFLLSLAIIYFLLLNQGGDFSTYDRFTPDEATGKVDFTNGLMDLQIENDKAPKIIKDSVLTALDSLKGLKEFNEQRLKKDSLMMANPKNYLLGLEINALPVRWIGKCELFMALLRSNRITGYGELAQTYGLHDTFENRMAFLTARNVLKIQKQPSAFISSFISKLPFAVFIGLPVFALFIWLAYIRKKYTYTDHLIFSFHNTSLLFILLIISYLIDFFFHVNSGWIFFTIFSMYLFNAMRKFYGQGVLKTIVKYVFLNAIFFILAGVAIVVLSTGSIITY